MQHDVVLGTDGLGKPSDILDRGAADLARPFRRLRHSIVLAEHITLEVLLGTGRQRLGIVANAVLVQKVEIDVIQANHLIGHGQQKRRVGTGAHANPASVEHASGHVVLGSDEHELDAGLFCQTIVVGGVAGIVPSGIHAIEHDGLGIQHIEAVIVVAAIGQTARDGAAHADGRVVPVAIGFGGVPLQTAAEQVEHRPIGSHANHAAGTVVVIDALQFVCHVIERLVPADALPTFFTAQLAMGVLATARLPALALHGVFHAVGIEHMLAHGVAARARTLLRMLKSVLVYIVSFLAKHDAVLN